MLTDKLATIRAALLTVLVAFVVIILAIFTFSGGPGHLSDWMDAQANAQIQASNTTVLPPASDDSQTAPNDAIDPNVPTTPYDDSQPFYDPNLATPALAPQLPCNLINYGDARTTSGRIIALTPDVTDGSDGQCLFVDASGDSVIVFVNQGGQDAYDIFSQPSPNVIASDSYDTPATAIALPGVSAVEASIYSDYQNNHLLYQNLTLCTPGCDYTSYVISVTAPPQSNIDLPALAAHIYENFGIK